MFQDFHGCQNGFQGNLCAFQQQWSLTGSSLYTILPTLQKRFAMFLPRDNFHHFHLHVLQSTSILRFYLGPASVLTGQKNTKYLHFTPILIILASCHNLSPAELGKGKNAKNVYLLIMSHKNNNSSKFRLPVFVASALKKLEAIEWKKTLPFMIGFACTLTKLSTYVLKRAQKSVGDSSMLLAFCT